MNSEKIIYSLSELPEVAKKLLTFMPQCAVYTFTGPLGAGKTALVREMLHQLGVKGPIASPTFTYVNTYENAQGQTFYHFDLYRIPEKEDFIAAGFDEYLYQSNSWCFIEWPEPIMPLLKQKVCHIDIDYYGESPMELKAPARHSLVSDEALAKTDGDDWKTGDKRELEYQVV